MARATTQATQLATIRFQYRFKEVDGKWSEWYDCSKGNWFCLQNANDFEKRIGHS